MHHGMHSLDQCVIQSFGDAIVLGRVVHGHSALSTLQLQMLRELSAKILSTVVGTKPFDLHTELGCQPALERLIQVERVRLCFLEVELREAGVVDGEGSVIATVSTSLHGRWTPQVGVYFVTVALT